MDWKKVAETKDLIVIEKEFKDYRIKIEARKAEDHGWEVFKTRIRGDSSNLISEYTLDTKGEVKRLIQKLKHDKEKARIENFIKRNSVKVSLKRIFKEEFVEKWDFVIGDDKTKNFMIVKFDSNIMVDIVIHEKYRLYERIIIKQMEEKLGLKELGDTIDYELYYFRRNNSTREITKQEHNNNFIDIEFDFSDDEEN